MKTSEKIKHLRTSKGLSQEALGDLVGVKKAVISKYETGRVVNIKRSTLQRLADALGVNPADLLDDVEHTPSMDLTASELSLLESFRLLDDVDQAKASSYIDGLLSNDKYIKTVVDNSVG